VAAAATGYPKWALWFLLSDGTLQPWVSSVIFFGLIGIGGVMLFRLDRDPTSTFKFYQFLSNKEGQADKYALGYLFALGVSSWGLWFLISHDRLTEWFWNGYIWAFVVGAAAVGITKAIKAPQPPNEPPPPGG
jgi:hypothetical protein